MGTEYPVFVKGGIELTIDEMSCRFQLSCDRSGYSGEPTNIFEDLTPEDLVEMGAKLLQTASYFIGDKDFPEALAKKLDAHRIIWRPKHE